MLEDHSKPVLNTPWGPAENGYTDIGSGVLSISTSSHGGLFIPKEAAKLIPKKVRDTFIEGSRKRRDGGVWAEEDLEMAIAIAFLFDHLDKYALGMEFNERLVDKDYWKTRAAHIATVYPRYQSVLNHISKD